MDLININKIKNYYFIISDKIFFVTEVKNQILSKILNEKYDNSSVIVFDFEDKEKQIDIDDITEELKTNSLFSDKKVIIIKGIEEIDNNILEKIILLTNDIPENIYLLFTGNEKSCLKKLKEIPEENIIYISGDDTDKIKKYFYEYINENQKQIDAEVIDLICNEANFDPYLIKNELDKIIFYIGEKKIITIEDFDKVKGVEKEYDIWALLNAICNNDEKKAFIILEKIYDIFEPEFILGSIFSNIKRIFTIIYYIKAKNMSQKDIINKIGKSAYYLMNYIKNFKGVMYTEIIDILKEADTKIKISNRKDTKVILTVMLEKIFDKISQNKSVKTN